MHSEFTGPAKDTEGREERNGHKGEATQNAKLTQSASFTSVSSNKDAGMGGGEAKIEKNEVEVFSPLLHLLFDLHRHRSCC